MAVESIINECPRGHSLPHKTRAGECTPFYCAADNEVKRKTKEIARATREAEQTVDEAAKDALGQEMKFLGRAAARETARHQRLNVPKGLSESDAERWIAAKKVELAMLAEAELEYRLRYGDDNQRFEAAKFALDARGHGKKESDKGGNTNVIVINGLGELPWRKKKPAELVDATEVKVLEAGDAQE